MGSKWKTSFLTDHYSISSGLSKPAKDFGTGYPFLSFKDIFYNYFLPDSLTQLVQSTDKERASCSVRRGDVFLTRTSETMHELGMSSVALKDYTDATFNGFCKRLRPKETSELEPEYVGYYLRSPVFRQSMLAFSTMSTRASLNNEMISRLEISYPDRKIQKKIANILLSLDEKIAISRAINQTLEQISQTLFKSWFVDFDPVMDNALDAGNPIPEALHSRSELRQKVRNSADFKPLPADIRALFTAEFEETELGWVPRGWKEGSIPDIAFINSTSWGTKNQPDYVNYVDLSNAKDGIISSIEEIPFEDAPSRARRILKKDDLIFGLVRPANRSFAYVHVDGLTGSTGFAVIRAKNKIYKNFIYYFVTYDKNIEELARIADGGAYPAIKPDDIYSLPLIIPPEEIVQRFDESTSNFRDLMNNSLVQNDHLTTLRDTLLPKLISGELSLEDLPDLVTQTEPA
ncbi:TPA: restriction endonuclease subunit S [Klebsiella quasipneumoniae subsp. quasipneumoniae]|nr:restriction endonuclease subunit S [Klebsiella quasipneumoniae subsp. quasipneumoniae]HCI6901556.1 restriction endonuclease subunit S [Klebsiella quasipneumoniae subsp. quasipneumoniae]HCI6903561.1 restriction endonuclease subunit S [Klebsiella quasipneumoniae subsp. quasipneumoniae]